MHPGSPRRSREREKGAERVFEEIMAEKAPNLLKDMNIISRKFNESL